VAGNVLINDGFGNIQTLFTDFNSGIGPNEASGATGDSGGAVFDTSGKLLGVMLAVDSFGGQPGGTAMYGNNTYAADISFYRSIILATVPEPSTWALTLGGLALLVLSRFSRERVVVRVRAHSATRE